MYLAKHRGLLSSSLISGRSLWRAVRWEGKRRHQYTMRPFSSPSRQRNLGCLCTFSRLGWSFYWCLTRDIPLVQKRSKSIDICMHISTLVRSQPASPGRDRENIDCPATPEVYCYLFLSSALEYSPSWLWLHQACCTFINVVLQDLYGPDERTIFTTWRSSVAAH